MVERVYHCDCGEGDCNVCYPPTPAPELPTVGRLVHFIQSGSGAHSAAMVTEVPYVDFPSVVKLLVFRPYGEPRHEHYIEQGNSDGTWHWPERVA